MATRRYPRVWQDNRLASKLLSPLGHGVALLARWRYQRAAAGRTPVVWPTAPVVVVGNISVGGTGKTPLTIWLVERARALGFRPGVVLRGYGGRDSGPTPVAADSSPEQVGDEAVLIARRTRAPVWVGKDRPAAAEGLLGDGRVNMIFSDDGLQHYRLGRDVELAVVDARRGYGNQRCLPAGPLREPVERLATVDLVLANGGWLDGAAGRFEIKPARLLPLDDDHDRPLPGRGQTVDALAGIGDPERFFAQLEALGFVVRRHPLPDHHAFSAADFQSMGDDPVIMTEKDAVKCRDLAPANAWYLPVAAEPDAATMAHCDGLLDAAVRRFEQRSRPRRAP
jgi:tetraacyldisaccharide 4'-kinase